MDRPEIRPFPGRSADPFAIRERIRAAGLGLGFSRVGFAAAVPGAEMDRLRTWLDRGYHGGMAWMARDVAGRGDPERILPGARSVVVVSMRYRHPDPPRPEAAPRISCYAWGDDYHEVLGARLRALEVGLRAEHERTLAEQAVTPSIEEPVGERFGASFPAELRTRLACDTSPVMDKAWAEAAGIGWLGKNACLIHPREGSWFFLGEIFTNLPLPPDAPVEDRCGTCRRCIDACPTDALVEPYVLDARRCISYLTIEHRGDFGAEERAALGEWLVGCDICQEVCPWNRQSPLSDEPRFAPRAGLVERTAAEWRDLDDEHYREAVRGTAITRVKPGMMRRNAGAVIENRKEGDVDG